MQDRLDGFRIMKPECEAEVRQYNTAFRFAGRNKVKQATARKRYVAGMTQIVDEFFKLKNGLTGTVEACDFKDVS